MKIRIESGHLVGEGTASPFAPSIDADLARSMLGCACFEVRADGSIGRSVDPTCVKMVAPWPSMVPHTDDLAMFARIAKDYRPCEALRLRDPGAS